MMTPQSLHILLTYKCLYECEHCFVWGSPQQTGVFTIDCLHEAFLQARDCQSIRELYFEGGETFVYYPVLLRAIATAAHMGFATGIVSNGYWASSVGDARVWLEPLVEAGLNKIEISVDDYHGDDHASDKHPALVAAAELGLPAASIAVSPPTCHTGPGQAETGAPFSNGDVMFRGRAAKTLTKGLSRWPWQTFTRCPHEKLATPGRVHLDPFGNVHLCQGLLAGNIFQEPLRQILANYDPEKHPIVGPLLQGGPARLVEQYGLEAATGYVDACHLCYCGRESLRARFASQLGPDQMYGVA